jgi:BirA family biotin operon repressor/biotin-[acetyl-CoA-carboxylase] ligase
VALAEALLASSGLHADIKWPNDLIVRGRKLAGILAEASGAAPSFDHVIVGLGVNLTRASYPASIASRVTSIEHERGIRPDRGLVLGETLAALCTWHARLSAGRYGTILNRWRELSPSSRGTIVEWATADGVARGTTAGIDDDGALLVRVGTSIERIVGGDVHWSLTTPADA